VFLVAGLCEVLLMHLMTVYFLLHYDLFYTSILEIVGDPVQGHRGQTEETERGQG